MSISRYNLITEEIDRLHVLRASTHTMSARLALSIRIGELLQDLISPAALSMQEESHDITPSLV